MVSEEINARISGAAIKYMPPRISTAIPKLKMVPCHIIGPTE